MVLSNLQVIHSGHTLTVAWRGKVPVPDISTLFYSGYYEQKFQAQEGSRFDGT